MLIPGRVGLVAVDSFEMGLPIVTTDWPLHAPEFEYLSNNRNSIISQDSLNDYVANVIDVLNDKERMHELRANCFEDARKYSIEQMVSNFHAGVLKALGAPYLERDSNA